jgi:hypothetical protein
LVRRFLFDCLDGKALNINGVDLALCSH